MQPPSARAGRGESPDIDDVSRWLVDRDAICADEIVEWMVQGTSLSISELASRWTDRDWAWALSDLIVEAVDENSDSGEPLVRGFLRGVSAGRGVGIFGLDGTTQWVHFPRWAITHPAHLIPRQAWRVLALEAGIEQHIDQLQRAVFVRDRSVHADGDTVAVVAPSDARDAAGDAAGAAADDAAGGAADATRIEPFWQDGSWLEAHIADTPAGRRLSFHDEDGRAVQLAAVGDVVWSEAVRLAA